jgi:hypothetical protein
MWEEDGGQSGEIRDKVETTINDAIKIIALKFPVVGAVKNLLGETGNRIIRSMANVFKELFADDKIGQRTITLDYFDFTDELPKEEEWGDTGSRFRKVVKIDGGAAGIYHVLLNWTVTPVAVPER